MEKKKEMKKDRRHSFIVRAIGFNVVAAVALLASCSSQTNRSQESTDPPNILFLMSDNQRWDMMGCAGNSIIQTPNMDRLAANGVRLPNTFVTTPICAASRASILTGLYRRRHQFTFHTPPFRAEFAAISYPTLLRNAGYRTGFIGKFGLGPHPNVTVEGDEATLNKMFDVFDNYHWRPHGYFPQQPDGTQRHLSDITAQKAIDFLRQSGSEQPFCLTVSFNAPHAVDDDPRQYIWPEGLDDLYREAAIPVPETADPAFFEALPEFIQNSESRKRWHWRFDTPEKFQQMMKGMYRMVSGVDRAMGTILEELKTLGLENNTVIVFMSDNGMLFGERGLSDCWLMYEDSIRVPLIIYDPRAEGKLRGMTAEQIVLNVDIAPTIIELAGLKVSERIQGRSLLPLLRNEEPEWRSDFLCEHFFQSRKHRIPPSEGVRTERWKYIRYFEQQPVYEELYDLQNDPMETVNLLGDPQYAVELKQLRKRCDALIQEIK